MSLFPITVSTASLPSCQSHFCHCPRTAGHRQDRVAESHGRSAQGGRFCWDGGDEGDVTVTAVISSPGLHGVLNTQYPTSWSGALSSFPLECQLENDVSQGSNSRLT